MIKEKVRGRCAIHWFKSLPLFYFIKSLVCHYMSCPRWKLCLVFSSICNVSFTNDIYNYMFRINEIISLLRLIWYDVLGIPFISDSHISNQARIQTFPSGLTLRLVPEVPRSPTLMYIWFEQPRLYYRIRYSLYVIVLFQTKMIYIIRKLVCLIWHRIHPHLHMCIYLGEKWYICNRSVWVITDKLTFRRSNLIIFWYMFKLITTRVWFKCWPWYCEYLCSIVLKCNTWYDM